MQEAILGISAFYHDSAAALIVNGEIVAAAHEERFTRIKQDSSFPHSLGLLYSAFTYYCGFKVNSGEYKLMGLAPYGMSGSAQVEKWKALILAEMVDLRADGSFLLNMDYFDYATGLTMSNDDAWERLFGVPRRKSEADPDQNTMISKILLTVLFIAMVLPVGLIRRAMGKDVMQIKRWKKDRDSVFRIRNHDFSAQDLEHPY